MPRVHLDELTNWFARAANKSLSDQLVAAYLRGSAARGDNIHGISDVDFYVIVRDSAFLDASSKQIMSQSLDTLVQEANVRWAVEKPSFRIVPLSYLKANKVGRYLTSLEAEILLGSDILTRAARPSSTELSQFGREEFKRLSDFWTQRESNVTSFESLSEMAAYKQYVVLKLAQTALFSRGIVALRKQEVPEVFRKEFPTLDSADVVEKAQRLRETGLGRSLDSELRRFIDEADKFHGILRVNFTSKKVFP